jgi:succinate dehydrogenase/fumarate reductase flavoprotein subunit
VILAEKGWCGTSGVAATAGTGHWWVPPDPVLRAQAVARRHHGGLGLSEPAWMERVLDTTWRTLPTLSGHYAFPQDEAGVVQYRALRGPEYMKAMRAVTEQAGVTILDHTPALGLLRHADGSVAGARLWRRRARRPMTFARGRTHLATRPAELLGHVWLPNGKTTTRSAGAVMAAVATEMHDYDRNLFRTAPKLRGSLSRLDGLWDTVRAGLHDATGDPLRAREAAALVACGRWAWEAALARRESRGMHQREDAPWTDPSQASRRLVGGLDHVWTRSQATIDVADAVA